MKIVNTNIGDKMKKIITLGLTIVVFSFIGCANKNVEAPKKPSVEKPKIEKKLPKKDIVVRKNNKKKIIKTQEALDQKKNTAQIAKEYKKVITKNIQKKQKLDQSKVEYEASKKSLLQEMELIKKEFTQTQDRKKYLLKKDKILQELKAITQKHEKNKVNNQIVNFTKKD